MDQRRQLQRLVLQRLESLHLAGVLDLPQRVPRPRGDVVPAAASAGAVHVPAPVAPPAKPVRTAPVPPEAAVSGGAAPPAAIAPEPRILFPVEREMASTPTLSRAQRLEGLDQVSREVAHCRRCAELVATRTQTVFGTGNPMARLVFLGEAPGADEDRQGEPFVGRAGQLLNDILAACTLKREDVYILNILKCRPPGNRAPQPQEVSNCRDYLLRQLEIIRPEFICCLGAVAAQNLLDTTTPIGQLRGRIHQFGQIKVVATYHPAYLLRNQSAKRLTWDDMKMLMRAMGIKLPAKKK